METLKSILGLSGVLPSDLLVPIYVMLPLDFALDSRVLSASSLTRRLRRLSEIGVRGIMVDVWWGLCEPSPKTYEFTKYVELADQCSAFDLEMQAVMSFHRCGGNVGDSVTIPLPTWVLEVGNKHQTWFMDREGRPDDEYISFGVDKEEIFYGRSPIQMYRDFMDAFVEAMGPTRMGTVVTELQVGVGPCGELRYPSYRAGEGLWKFPGIGEFQCFDQYLMENLKRSAEEQGHPEWSLPPEGTGSYNDQPQQTDFFCDKEDGGKWVSDRARFFAQWYFQVMLDHGERLIAEATDVLRPFNGKVSVACKVAGIHWWYASQSHAAEMTSGYNNAGYEDPYDRIAQMLQNYNAIFDFTCLEMYNTDQPKEAKCAPENLVRQVLTAARRHSVRFAGENALPRYDTKAYRKIEKVYHEAGSLGVGFTYLRFTDELFGWWYFWAFSDFTKRMGSKSRL